MIEAQRINCKNNAFVVMSFRAKADAYETPPSGDLLISQDETFDLAYFPFPEGPQFWPLVTVGEDEKRPDQSIAFRMNSRTAYYGVSGFAGAWNINFDRLGDPTPPLVPGFPSNIPLNVLPYRNWDEEIVWPGVLTCAPRTADDVAAVCNWAKDNGFLVRPRGVMHGWSPTTVARGFDPKARVLLVDLTKALHDAHLFAASASLPARVKVGAGKTMLELMTFLEAQSGGGGAAPGYSFPHIPAPGNLTVGGVLAIDAHGTAVPTPPHDDFPASYGSMSNQILEFTAIVTDPNSPNPDQYRTRVFRRDENDAAAFLTHLGRSLLVDATLQVIPNYNLRCQSFTNFSPATLFAAPTAATPVPPDSFGDFLNRYGRIEIIWFRIGTNPWLHVWSVEPTKPNGARQVDVPYNYPFADNVPAILQEGIRTILDIDPSFTPTFGKIAATVTANGLDGKDFLGQPAFPPSRDLWGASKNTLFYIQDSTLQVTANGYALHMRKADVQQAVHDFTQKFSSLLEDYEPEKFPVNSAVEIRVTALDDPARVAIGSGLKAESPVISALIYDDVARKNRWDVALWVDVLTIPKTNFSTEFYADLEAWIMERFSGAAARTLPEWSKGWAYAKGEGAWGSQPFIDFTRKAFTEWKYETDTLAKYDKHGLFRSPLLDRLFAK
jgi:FAD/FMN-containing dehydrogenase